MADKDKDKDGGWTRTNLIRYSKSAKPEKITSAPLYEGPNIRGKYRWLTDPKDKPKA